MAIIFKSYVSGDALSASDLRIYAMNQVVMTFASSAARNTALSGEEVEGMIVYLQDVDQLMAYDGAAWIRMAWETDIAAADTRSTLMQVYML